MWHLFRRREVAPIILHSHAIMKYIHATRSLPDHWMPADPRRAAVVNAFLDWHMQ